MAKKCNTGKFVYGKVCIRERIRTSIYRRHLSNILENALEGGVFTE